jgi:transcriptional regulator
MYVPKSFRDDDRQRLSAFMREHAFATLVSLDGGEPIATHLPLTLRDEGEALTLRGHLARANPHWRALEGGVTLAIFTGPHAYVSATHYDRHESVPTWNYLAVHASGRARIVSHDAEVEALLADLIAANEPGYQARWESLSARYRDGMKGGIVAFELTVERLQGALKLSQNKTDAERSRIAHDLLSSADAAARATGEAMLACPVHDEG